MLTYFLNAGFGQSSWRRMPWPLCYEWIRYGGGNLGVMLARSDWVGGPNLFSHLISLCRWVAESIWLSVHALNMLWSHVYAYIFMIFCINPDLNASIICV